MNITSSTLNLHRMRFHALHGVLPQERLVGNDYEVTVSLDVDLSRAVESDDVSDTVNYAEVYEAVKEQMAIPSQLIEHVAGRIANALLSRFAQLQAVEVSVKKLNPPMGADLDGAEVKIKVTFPR
ncbi:MAG: dihydroneopterin aldolase [Prevotella sp.]|nr:dihydroneopterin aldolase [Prevotella sp.]